MRGTETHEINGKKYEFFLIPPPEALKILTRLVKRVLPSVGGAFSGNDIKGMADALTSVVNLDSLTLRLSENMHEQEVSDTIQALLKHVRIEGREINMNVDFPGELLTMMKVVYKVLEVNYSDFFDALKEKLGLVIKRNTTQAK